MQEVKSYINLVKTLQAQIVPYGCDISVYIASLR